MSYRKHSIAHIFASLKSIYFQYVNKPNKKTFHLCPKIFILFFLHVCMCLELNLLFFVGVCIMLFRSVLCLFLVPNKSMFYRIKYLKCFYIVTTVRHFFGSYDAELSVFCLFSAFQLSSPGLLHSSFKLVSVLIKICQLTSEKLCLNIFFCCCFVVCCAFESTDICCRGQEDVQQREASCEHRNDRSC